MDNEILPNNLMSKLPMGGILKATDIVDSTPNQDITKVGSEAIIRNSELTFFTLAPVYMGIKHLTFDLYDQFRADIDTFHSMDLPKLIECEYDKTLLSIDTPHLSGKSNRLYALPTNVFNAFKDWLRYQAFSVDEDKLTWVIRCGRYKIFDPVDKKQTELATIHIFLPWSTICEPKVEVLNDFVVRVSFTAR